MPPLWLVAVETPNQGTTLASLIPRRFETNKHESVGRYVCTRYVGTAAAGLSRSRSGHTGKQAIAICFASCREPVLCTDCDMQDRLMQSFSRVCGGQENQSFSSVSGPEIYRYLSMSRLPPLLLAQTETPDRTVKCEWLPMCVCVCHVYPRREAA